MSALQFEWDSTKASANLRKHGVSFEEAVTVFADENGLLLADPDHSEDEERFLLLGLSTQPRLLVVSHCYREDQDTIRLISARKADRSERQQYAERWQR